ncbi:MAG TPA: arginase family protein, partial [Thermoleophilia bacterium]|nr:arginase family protein [Thermoleophilia bacterium]
RAQNSSAVTAVARAVAGAIRPAARRDERLLVVGGDCTILLGLVAGLLYAGDPGDRLGLAYLDAHPDLNTPTAIVQGALDWMGLAHLLGEPTAVERLSHLGPRFPLLDDDEIALLGVVPSEVTGWEREVIERRHLHQVTYDELAADPAGVADVVGRRLEDRSGRFVVHFDVDVIDYVDFPIADNAYQRNQGLTLGQALETVAALAARPGCAGLVVSQVNPDHLEDRERQARTFVDGLALAVAGNVGSARGVSIGTS